MRAPESRCRKPNRFATACAVVVFPDPAGPSRVITMRRVGPSATFDPEGTERAMVRCVPRSGARRGQVFEHAPKTREAHVRHVGAFDLDTIPRKRPEHAERHGDAVVVMARHPAGEGMVASLDFEAITQLLGLYTHGSEVFDKN